MPQHVRPLKGSVRIYWQKRFVVIVALWIITECASTNVNLVRAKTWQKDTPIQLYSLHSTADAVKNDRHFNQFNLQTRKFFFLLFNVIFTNGHIPDKWDGMRSLLWYYCGVKFADIQLSWTQLHTVQKKGRKSWNENVLALGPIVSVIFSYLSSEYSELNNSFILLFSHSLCGQLQPTNQIDLSPLLDFGVFSEKQTATKTQTINILNT